MLDSREEFLLKEKSLEELRNKQKEEKLNKPITLYTNSGISA